MILDKLMEKKDLAIYIDCRIAHLKNQLKPSRLKKTPKKERERLKIKVMTRIEELKYLKKVVSNKTLKGVSKTYWKEYWKKLIKGEKR